ncbi:diadenylate cyclase [Malacoplasma iowae]|uniref:DNA integrity scanning protein DisA nucleotide-binding domain protein n=1 Tax=Malacoplasma iowae 695 TaxID=1048830 RepID=A0A6P1LH66_MALIO|nr:DNA integrity scanning protein DisA nucleotide-binding domain protein [Malacoplasma iowae]QHG89751.2 DNA integrity scanning protein DisA nucleotide-binding domain protein [Malacoplasma iowae 695]WPL35453.1 DNA integrity scanning protein DisA nucleotide-binding domain protein [Malacoplasma iowae]VEU62463.1 DNA integrity-scanning diadenylate cyclase [Mycoplasmopsis fermentans]VEU72289.1 DNA integrity-scanning diadenylate cyclase [Malacoplasma iowae]
MAGITFILVLISFIMILVMFVFFIVYLLKSKQIFGFKSNKNKSNHLSKEDKELLVKSLHETLFYLSSRKIGGLIVIEKNNTLSLYEETGFKVDAPFSPEFLILVFSNKSASFHDGAVIVSNNKIKSISCYLPISKNSIDLKYGSRHRAGLGITEVTDAIAFIVSETTGNISYTQKGKLHNMGQDKNSVNDLLNSVI